MTHAEAIAAFDAQLISGTITGQHHHDMCMLCNALRTQKQRMGSTLTETRRKRIRTIWVTGQV